MSTACSTLPAGSCAPWQLPLDRPAGSLGAMQRRIRYSIADGDASRPDRRQGFQTQEGAPPLGGRATSLDHVLLRHAGLSDLKAELEQLAMDGGCSLFLRDSPPLSSSSKLVSN